MTPSLNMCQVSSVQNYLQTCHPVKINLTCVICTGIPAHESTGQNYPDMCHPDKITWICVTRTKLTGYVSTRQNCPDMCHLDKTTHIIFFLDIRYEVQRYLRWPGRKVHEASLSLGEVQQSPCIFHDVQRV